MYRRPHQVLSDLLDAPRLPYVWPSPDRRYLVFAESPGFPSIEEVAQPWVPLGGGRLNTFTNAYPYDFYIKKLSVFEIKTGIRKPVEGLPDNAKIENMSWSPMGDQIGFTHTTEHGLEIWVLDLATATVQKRTDATVNNALGGLPYAWLPDGHFIWKSIVDGRGPVPQPDLAPQGPSVQESMGAVKSAVRTYQDLLRNSLDERHFEYFGTANLLKNEGQPNHNTLFASLGDSLIKGFSVSPDGQWVLVSVIRRPFSYAVPYSRFPFDVQVYTIGGEFVKIIEQVPLNEHVPDIFDAVRTGRRDVAWRPDQAATLYWAEALDGGDPKKEAPERDAIYCWDAPFDGEPQLFYKTEYRFDGILWGDGHLAILREEWFETRRTRSWIVRPGKPGEGKLLFDRSSEDLYASPGAFVTRLNQYGRSTLAFSADGQSLYLAGKGATPAGSFPFLDELSLDTLETKRLWRCEAPFYEEFVCLMAELGTFIIRRESQQVPANYFIKNYLDPSVEQPLTHFEHPYPAFKEVSRELVKYTRADGVELTGTLYLPPQFKEKVDQPLPTLLWAYPKEFKNAGFAGQVSDSPHRFTWVHSHSPILWVMRGYAVLDDPSMPIVGEGEQAPNETFTEQLVASAAAAVDYLVQRGIADPKRVAVGGHSYGAFMAAHLATHTQLFAAAISRSGAYNRTLTPFGFQNEDRSYWQAQDTYHKMSPFAAADKMKTPILLIHGADDNNPGTLPLQSERYFAALKGLGATAKLVLLPKEGHGYRAYESVMQMVADTDEWLERYLDIKGIQG